MNSSASTAGMRPLDLSEDLVALVSRKVAPSPGPAGLHYLSDADFEEICDRVCVEVPEQGLWIFTYGSLIWKPDFEHVASGAARLHGWRRAFCLSLINWRATPEQPGLMLALAPGGSCRGVAYRMPDDDRRGRVMRLLRREFDAHEDVAWMRWLAVRMNDGSVNRALTFYCAAAGHLDYVRMPFAAQVERLSRAVGHAGSGAEYLRNTVVGLQSVGIHDAYLWRLQAAVARQIRMDHGLS